MAAESQISKQKIDDRIQKTEDRRQKTGDRIGKQGNQDNRVQVIRITGDVARPSWPSFHGLEARATTLIITAW